MYPVNSGLMVEDPLTGEFMLVMNDRPQAGSAYKNGRLELMIHRIGSLNDDLGMFEPMRDVDQNGNDVDVRAKFYLAFP